MCVYRGMNNVCVGRWSVFCKTTRQTAADFPFYCFCCVTTRGQRFRIKNSPSFRNFKIIPFEYYRNSLNRFLSDGHNFSFRTFLSSKNFTGPDINVLGCLQPIVSPSISSYEQVIRNFET